MRQIVVRGVESSAKLAASSEVGEEGRGSTDEEAPLDTIHAALVSLMLMLANQDSGLPALVKLVYVLPVPYAVPVRYESESTHRRAVTFASCHLSV